MRFLAVFSCIILYCRFLPASDQFDVLQEKTSQLRQDDKVEAFIYAYLDAFLTTPDPERLILLETVEDSLWRPLQKPGEKLAFVILKSNQGFYQAQFSRIAKAILAYEAAWKMYETQGLQGFDIVEYCLKPLGNAYTMLGDFNSAEKIVKSYLLKAREHDNPEHLSAALVNLSIIYYSTGNHTEAIGLLEQGLDSPNLPEEKKGLFYANLARNYLAIGRYDAALGMSNKAISYLWQYPRWDSSAHLVNAYSGLSIIFQQTGESGHALESIRMAAVIADTSKSVNQRIKAKVKIQRAGILSETGEPMDAIDLYKSILQGLIHGYDAGSGLPEKRSLYAENTLKEAFDGMARIYSEMDSLQLALDCYHLSFEVENLLRKGYNYRQAKYLQQQENRNRAESAILLLIRMHGQEGRDDYIKKAFEIAENTKSIVLKAAYYERRFWSYIRDDSTSRIRKQLNLQKAQLQNAVIQEQLKGNDADLKRIEQLIDRQNQVMLAGREHQSQAASGLPEFVKQEGIMPDSLQRVLLSGRETLIEYFMGQDYLFIFVLDGKTIRLFTVDSIQSLKDEVKLFLSYFGDPNKINNNPDDYARTAFRLYDRLIPREADSSLIIVPDGMLNFIPFEALLYEAPGDALYAQWPWALKKQPIAYRTSAAELLQIRSTEKTKENAVLGIFPEFPDSPRFLNYSREEAEEIKRYFTGKYFFTEKATKQAFLENISEYPIVHLSTHADAGDLYTPPSIAFIDSALYLPEIYGLDVQNKLMALSACETGTGKVHAGENAISLANGFVQAGVNNILFSLWRVNDYSTSRLMADFYRHYAKDEVAYLALRNAKLDYLEDENISPGNKSPYFWASFIYYGQTSAEIVDDDQGRASPLTMPLLVLGAIILLYIGFRVYKGL